MKDKKYCNLENRLRFSYEYLYEIWKSKEE